MFYLMSTMQLAIQNTYVSSRCSGRHKSVCLTAVEWYRVPGEQLLRISTDFGTGATGIGLYLHRLAHAVPWGTQTFSWMPFYGTNCRETDIHLGIAIHS